MQRVLIVGPCGAGKSTLARDQGARLGPPVLRRIWTWRGRSRPDMPDDCPERIDLAFLWYVVRWNAGPGQRLEARLRGHVDKVLRLHSPAALATWLETLDGGEARHDMAPLRGLG